MPQPTSQKSILILSSHPRLVFLVVSFPHVSPQHPVCTSSPHMCYMPCPSPSWLGHPNNSWWEVQSIKLFVMATNPRASERLRQQAEYLNVSHATVKFTETSKCKLLRSEATQYITPCLLECDPLSRITAPEVRIQIITSWPMQVTHLKSFPYPSNRNKIGISHA